MRVIVSGGGTGGHIYPAISIIEELGENDEILYVGGKGSMESQLIPKLGYKFKGITIQGFNRKNKLANITTVIKLVFALIRSFFIILKFKPDVVIGTGGYVSGPVVYMATLLNKKTFIHEQNAYPGLTNKILSKYVDRVFVSYEQGKEKFKNEKINVVGNPVRKNFKIKLEDSYDKKENEKTILAFGGSGGAKTINDLMYEVIKEFNGNENYIIYHVTGKKYYDEFMGNIKKEDLILKENIHVLDYLNDMPKYMAAADLVISRAGAITISELKYTKTPSILIPSPNVTDNHQEFNARVLENEKISWMILEKQLNSEKIMEVIKNETYIENMKHHFESIESYDSAKIIIDEIKKGLKK